MFQHRSTAVDLDGDGVLRSNRNLFLFSGDCGATTVSTPVDISMIFWIVFDVAGAGDFQIVVASDLLAWICEDGEGEEEGEC